MKERKLKIGLALIAALAVVFAAGCGDTINNYYGDGWDNSSAYAGKTYTGTATSAHSTSAVASMPLLDASFAFADDGTVTITVGTYEHVASSSFSLGSDSTRGSGLEACVFDGTSSDGYCGVYYGSVTGTYFTSTSDTEEYVFVIMPADSNGDYSSAIIPFKRINAGGSLTYSGDWSSFNYMLDVDLVASSTGTAAGTSETGNSTSVDMQANLVLSGWTVHLVSE